MKRLFGKTGSGFRPQSRGRRQRLISNPSDTENKRATPPMKRPPVSVQASNKSAANSPVKASAPEGAARMVRSVPDGCHWKRAKRSGCESTQLHVSNGSTEGPQDPSTPARGRWGDSNRIGPGSVPVLRDELGAAVTIHRYPPERLRPPALFFGVLQGSEVSHRHRTMPRTKRSHREQGIALVVVLGVVAILSVLVSDFDYGMATAYKVAESKRDRLQAEYLAKSGLNLTRLLIAKERDIRNAAAIFLKPLIGGTPQLNVWDFANEILAPFSDYKATVEMSKSAGMDFSQMEGMLDTGGSFEIVAMPENGLINISDPLYYIKGIDEHTSVAMQLYALMGGYQSPESPYDVMFEDRDADGQYTNRLDIVSDIIDWWDPDELRTIFDPGAQKATQAGSEDDIYETFVDPYEVKNAPFDSLEELRMIRGIDDDFWATFVEPDPDDPKSRQLTVYASGMVNVNVAKPEVLLFRLCSFQAVQASLLCTDLEQMQKFVWLFNTARSILPIVFFPNPESFIQFLEGNGKLYTTLSSILGGPEGGMLFKPITLPADRSERDTITRSFIASAKIFTIQSTGYVGRATVRIRTVVNQWERWKPPKPNAGKVPGLGVYQYYRIE